MSLRDDVRNLLSQLPGRHAPFEAVRFLKEPESFYRIVPKSEAEIEEDIGRLLAKYPGQYTKESARQSMPTTKAEELRPDWLGPQPTINRLSDVPVSSANAFEAALALEFLELYWGPDGDAHVYITHKGRAALAGEEYAATPNIEAGTETAQDDWPILLAAEDLATRVGATRDAVNAFLRRLVELNPDCRTEVPNPRVREPRYLYRTALVRKPLLEHFRKPQA